MAKFILTFRGANWMQYQGRVVGKGKEEGSWKVRLFSWLTGMPNKVVTMTREELKDALWFDNMEEWRAKGTELFQRDRQRRNAGEVEDYL